MVDPLLDYLDDVLDAAWMPFGPPVPGVGVEADAPPQTLRVAEHYGAFEVEYAALRRSVGVVHAPWKAALRLNGADAADFLHRMCTQDVLGLPADGGVAPALLLDAKGHILADFAVQRDPSGCTVWVDRFDLATLHQQLDRMLFAEDVTLSVPPSAVFLLAGPAAGSAVAEACDSGGEVGEPLSPGRAVGRSIGGVPVSVWREDGGGTEPLLHVATTFEADDADAPVRVLRALLTASGLDPDAPHAEPTEADAERRRQTLRGTASGWAAFNTWRVETRRPMFHLDYGPTSLPAEAHRVASHVSLTKGCFAGQEAVARMHNLGHPKKLIVALDLERGEPPATGAEVTADGQAVGAVTSSAASPLRGQAPVALATVRWGRHEAGEVLAVNGVRAEVRPMGG